MIMKRLIVSLEFNKEDFLSESFRTIQRARLKFIYATRCGVSHVLYAPRPFYYRNANRITMPAHGVLQSREQICRLPSGTRLPSILLERVGMLVRDALSLAGFSRCCRVAAASRRSRSFSDPLKRVGGERQKNSRSFVARNTMQFRGESLRRSFFPPASLSRN